MLDRRTLLLGSAAAGAILLGACAKSTTTARPRARTGYLKVPGARLYYETRGSGSPLLMIHGGGTDAGSFTAIAPELAEHYTVITYDRRGNSRSHLDGPSADLRLDQQADDAALLLKTLIDTPPHVFGSSGGAIVALELATRYPDRLGTVVAHEPPVPAVLQDAAAQQEKYEAVYQTYRARGVQQAFQQFMTIDPGEEDPAADADYPADPDFAPRIQGNQEFLLAHEMLPFTRYRPDLAALRAKLPELVLGVGRYRAKIATRIVSTLADRLGTQATTFPGDHTGYIWRPREFAEKLHAALT
ncbi:alpha/beta fold hydrolase [Sphaerisporangium corydalis]|uniref:Alpha/beta fold hydrolase n=1 Tax=Sphaerisporangium corydalis TaxID=1441875 RepID=A0ABV9ETT6_9ACTN|nr:alpha/beta hydrolase [Sphaerisporangium corydalis]